MCFFKFSSAFFSFLQWSKKYFPQIFYSINFFICVLFLSFCISNMLKSNCFGTFFYANFFICGFSTFFLTFFHFYCGPKIFSTAFFSKIFSSFVFFLQVINPFFICQWYNNVFFAQFFMKIFSFCYYHQIFAAEVIFFSESCNRSKFQLFQLFRIFLTQNMCFEIINSAQLTSEMSFSSLPSFPSKVLSS